MFRRKMRTQSEWNVEISGRGGAVFAASFLGGLRRALAFQQRRRPLLHFGGRLLRERDGQNPLAA